MLIWLCAKKKRFTLCHWGAFTLLVLLGLLHLIGILQTNKAALASAHYEAGKQVLEQLCTTLEISKDAVMERYLTTYIDTSLRELLTNDLTLNLSKENEYKRCLSRIQNTNAFVDSVGIYFEKNRRILYSDIGISDMVDAGFIGWYYHDKSTEKIVPTHTRANPQSGKKTDVLSVWIKFPVGYSQNFGGAVLINIDYAAVSAHLQQRFIPVENGCFYVVDNTGNVVLATSSGELYQSFSSLPMKKFPVTGGKVTAFLYQGKPYFLCQSERSFTEYTCYLLYPANSYLGTVEQLNWQFLLSGLGLSLCGGLLFGGLYILILHFHSELERMLPSYTNHLFTSLLLTSQSPDQIGKALALCGEQPLSSSYFISVLQTKERALRHIYPVITEVFGSGMQNLQYISLNESRIAVVADSNFFAFDILCSNWQSVILSVHQQQKCDIFIGVCGQPTAAEQLNNAFQQAIKAMRTQLSQNRRGMLCFNDMPMEQYPTEIFTSERSKKLLSFIRIGDVDKACGYFRKLFAEVTLKDSPIDTQLFFQQITTTIKSSLDEQTLSDSTIPDTEFCVTAEQVEDLIRNVALASGQKLQNKKTDQYFTQISGFIETNYMRDVSVEEICTYVGLSPTYVNKILRLYTNKSLVQNLNDKRIERACSLLANSNRKIKEIGEAIGFSSTKYFIKLFHASQNITPGEYRKLIDRDSSPPN